MLGVQRDAYPVDGRATRSFQDKENDVAKISSQEKAIKLISIADVSHHLHGCCHHESRSQHVMASQERSPLAVKEVEESSKTEHALLDGTHRNSNRNRWYHGLYQVGDYQDRSTSASLGITTLLSAVPDDRHFLCCLRSASTSSFCIILQWFAWRLGCSDEKRWRRWRKQLP